MKVLKRENWWVWLFFTFITFGISNIFLAKCLDVVEDNKWYSDITNWVLGILLCIFPFFIMAVVFEIQMTINAARKLCVTGEPIYTSPYIWLILFIIPVFGWILFIVMYLYLNIWIVIKLYEGKGEINI